MSVSMYRGQLKRKQDQRIAAEKKVGGFRKTEADKRTRATKATLAAQKAKSASTIKSRLQEAARLTRDADNALKSASDWQTKAASYLREEVEIERKLLRAEQAEQASRDRKSAQDQVRLERQIEADRRAMATQIDETRSEVAHAFRQLRAAKPEKLRILLLGASPEGDLRIGREQARIRKAVEAARHRDLVEFDVRTSATTDDLLDGLSRFRPHVVHFSGHSNPDIIQFEKDVDSRHKGDVVSSHAFAAAVAASDDPPLLVLLNSCNSIEQAKNLAREIVPFTIGMSDSIGDGDAIVYAAQFYAALTNGQSIQAAHSFGQAALELAGLGSAELPVLVSAPDVDPSGAKLVVPPEE